MLLIIVYIFHRKRKQSSIRNTIFEMMCNVHRNTNTLRKKLKRGKAFSEVERSPIRGFCPNVPRVRQAAVCTCPPENWYFKPTQAMFSSRGEEYEELGLYCLSWRPDSSGHCPSLSACHLIVRRRWGCFQIMQVQTPYVISMYCLLEILSSKSVMSGFYVRMLYLWQRSQF